MLEDFKEIMDEKTKAHNGSTSNQEKEHQGLMGTMKNQFKNLRNNFKMPSFKK